MDVPRAARLVADHIAAARLNSAVIVAHSKGGLVGKYVMLALDPDERIDRMIAVCTPFSGSRYARYLLIPSLRVFSPRNALTLQMAREESINHRITSPLRRLRPAYHRRQRSARGHKRTAPNRRALPDPWRRTDRPHHSGAAAGEPSRAVNHYAGGLRE
ncbi:hypothetical protein [Arthrobacter sp. 24S4-2]|uniref:hypothetical protein n=1 Tax=Arthrobacter sp. 24S4-2 TaxID=2575374 RepID=UPI0020C7A98D|nr:hypothetical protein [Arthrobacter sp. 24S4-2]